MDQSDLHPRPQLARDRWIDLSGPWGFACDDADVGLFRPERWITTGADGDSDGREAYDAQAGPMLSFGSGLRGCFGRKLAYVELKLLTTLIVWSFELERCPEGLSGYDRVEGLTQKPKDCYVALKKVVY